MGSSPNDIVAALREKGKALWGAAYVDVAIVGRDPISEAGLSEGSNARIVAYSNGDRARSGEMTTTGANPEEALATLTKAVDAEIAKCRAPLATLG